MENASKALIIAGAILISILIVGLGVIIYNNVSNIASGAGLTEQEITSHNSPFESYFGSSVSGSNVKALIAKVNANNNTASVNDEKVGNHIYLIDGTNAAIVPGNIKTGRTYSVSLSADGTYSDTDAAGTTYWKNGFIKTIVITVNN